MDEFVVVGAGLAGAAVAWRLAGRGHEVTVLEQFTPGNAQGSSHGSARIFRYAYPQRLYVDLMRRAADGWDELERNSGVQVLTRTGSLDFGDQRPVRSIAEVLETADVEHELLTAADAEQLWPSLRFDTEVLWHRDAGVLDAASAVEAMLDLAVSTGNARLNVDWPVARIEEVPGGYRVLGSQGRSVEAANVVVAAGGWLPELLGNLTLPADFVASFPALQVRQEQAVHFPYRTTPDPHTNPWPSFIYKGHDISTYGLPGGRDAEFRGQKVAQFNGGKIIGSAQHQDGVVDPAARQRLVDFAGRALPGVDPTPYAETTCLFTNTPTENFVFDRAANITVVSPCSGHGAKFAPLIGELAAELALGTHDVPDEFRLAAHAAHAAQAV